jgi:diguanylate cyclase (GGDEF)-like protein/PAS domain S-box-containing protein
MPTGDDDLRLADILDLFEEQVYAGEITPDGHYVNHTSGPRLERMIGGRGPKDVAAGELWESRIHPDDWSEYARFNADLLSGRDAEVTYRMRGLDGVTRTLWDRARPRRGADGKLLVDGIVSDVTSRREAEARLAEVSDRFGTLLDVIGEHVYLALVLPDGGLKELFQGPGADRLLGGAEPDPEMENWDAAVHPDDRPAVEEFNRTLAAGRDAEVEYRLRGADGITRWVHDRAATRRRPDGRIEISGIVSDVTERRRIRAELAEAHAALSRVVEAMDDHLYTLRVDPTAGPYSVYRGPNRERLAGGRLPAGDEDAAWDSLVHPDDRARRQEALNALDDDRPVELEYRVRGLDDVERVVLDRLRPRREADGALVFDGVTRDITERRRLEDELLRITRIDELTGAFNRRHFAERVAAALAAGTHGCGLLLADADHFKQVNDAHGHSVGDAVLVELVSRLQGELGADECLARWGGEEFAVFLRGVESDAQIEARAERLRAAVAWAPVDVHGVVVQMTMSIGAARVTDEVAGLDALVEAADRCLYVAKRDGRNRVSLVPHLAVPVDVPPFVADVRAPQPACPPR